MKTAKARQCLAKHPFVHKEKGDISNEKIRRTLPDGGLESRKHVPVIDCADQVKAGDPFIATVSVGKEIAHPNTTEHHIRWISVYFQPDDEKFTYQVGHFEFSAHGESTGGPNKGPVYTNHEVAITLKVSKPGVIYATSFCNIHGLWQSEKTLKIA